MTGGRGDQAPRPTWAADDEGATAVLFVFSFFVLLGAALLAIDGGLLWLSQRGQVADTDAAALAGVGHLLAEPCASQSEVDAVAAALVQANDPAADLADRLPAVAGDNVEVRTPTGACSINTTVVASTRREAVSVFAGAFGYGPIDTGVTSLAQVVAPPDIEGVVPLAFCEDDEHVAEWQAYVADLRDGAGGATAALAAYVAASSGPDHAPAGTYPGARTPVHRLPFDKGFATGTNDCGVEHPGNWGWVDFDGSQGQGAGVGQCASGSDRLCDWAVNGYGPGVRLGTPGDPTTYDCDAGDSESPPDDCPAGPGFRTGLRNAFAGEWRCGATTPTEACEVVWVVLYDGGNSAAGVVTEYFVSGLMPLVLREFGGTNASNGFLDVELIDFTYAGPGGPVPAGYTGPLGVALCGAGDFDNCNQ